MPRPSPIYSRIRAASSPNLGRHQFKYKIITQRVPEDTDSLPPAPSPTIVDDVDQENYLSEAVTFRTFISEQSLTFHPSAISFFDTLASSTDVVERVSYRQPLSIETEGSVHEDARQPTMPISPTMTMTPIVFQHPPSDEYAYLRPAFAEITAQERQTRDTDAEVECIRFRENPADIVHTHPFTNTATTVIRTTNEAYFEVYRCHHHLLEPGMRIVCFGDMVGIWFTTAEMRKHKQYGYTSWKWVNHEAKLVTIVRVDTKYIRPPTWTERVKSLAKRVRKMAKRTRELE
ncbi:hypothetical protein C8R47DRAFT_1077865 [Mycena vitilis]|nr:hypothetical protein C8R47DRAFT_1077865 [Mycena vitilis]